jgi:hypothetical protein
MQIALISSLLQDQAAIDVLKRGKEGGDGTMGGGGGIYGTASDWSSANNSGALIKMAGARGHGARQPRAVTHIFK